MDNNVKKFDEEKALDMLRYFIARARTIGKTKLMAMCYFADFDHYEKYSKAITWATYVKTSKGPHSYEIEQALESLVRFNVVNKEQKKHNGYLVTRYVAIDNVT